MPGLGALPAALEANAASLRRRLPERCIVNLCVCLYVCVSVCVCALKLLQNGGPNGGKIAVKKYIHISVVSGFWHSLRNSFWCYSTLRETQMGSLWNFSNLFLNLFRFFFSLFIALSLCSHSLGDISRCFWAFLRVLKIRYIYFNYVLLVCLFVLYSHYFFFVFVSFYLCSASFTFNLSLILNWFITN